MVRMRSSGAFYLTGPSGSKSSFSRPLRILVNSQCTRKQIFPCRYQGPRNRWGGLSPVQMASLAKCFCRPVPRGLLHFSMTPDLKLYY
jgi:hypothetical protein